MSNIPANVDDWLPDMLGPVELQGDGVPLPARAIINFGPNMSTHVEDDGQTLTVDAIPSSSGGSPDTEVPFVVGVQATSEAGFTMAGGRAVDMSGFPAMRGPLTRNVTFIADVQKSAGATSVEVQLFDLTNAIQVAGTNLVSASNDLTEVLSASLTVGGAAGNVRNDVAAMYEVDVKMNGGAPGDQVFLTNARLLIAYA